jgi:NitT/TauT family transport system substrate-binding protein
MSFGKRIAAAALAGFLGGAAGLAGTADAQGLEKVRALIPVKNIDEAFSPFAVAKHLGYFKDEGLDVDLLPVGGSNEVAIQVAAGNGDLGAASAAQAVVGMQQAFNLDVKYFYNLYYKNIWAVSVPAESPIKEIRELKGKKWGVASMGSAGVTYGRAFARAAGLDPQKDVSFLPIGGGAQAMTAVRQNAVDAIVYWDAALVKFDVSGLKLRDLPTPDELQQLPDVSLLTRQETIKSKSKMLVGFARAVAKAYDFTMANPAAAVEITWKLYPEAKPMNVAADKVLAEGVKVNQSRMVNWASPRTKGKHGFFIADDWKRVVEFMKDQQLLSQDVPVDRIFTNALIDEINKYDRPAIAAAAKAYK